ncbi:hypothetical protein GCM10010483_40410 [Actinokineospora diospyrosa]
MRTSQLRRGVPQGRGHRADRRDLSGTDPNPSRARHSTCDRIRVAGGERRGRDGRCGRHEELATVHVSASQPHHRLHGISAGQSVIDVYTCTSVPSPGLNVWPSIPWRLVLWWPRCPFSQLVRLDNTDGLWIEIRLGRTHFE